MCSTKGRVIATGTATGATGTTLVNSAKTWAVDQWINFQIRITSGLGAGQTRTITDSDATSVTVATWTITPNSTSVYSIEGNENHIYLQGNNATAFYRYNIAENTWTTMAVRVAPGLASSLHWISTQTNSLWTNESAILDGRRFYSFRGGATSTLDYYDIPSNTWTNDIAYANKQETFTTGTGYAYDSGNIYIKQNATNRCFKYSPSDNEITGFSTLLYTDGGALIGDKGFDISYEDGDTKLIYIYFLRNTGTELFRCLVI